MANATKPEPSVSVLAQHVSAHLSVFVVAESTDSKRPANGGLRLLNYPSDEACIADGQRLAGLMTHKHDLMERVSLAAKSWHALRSPLRSKTN